MILVILPPVGAQKTQCFGGPDVVIPPQGLLHESKSELFVVLSYCRIYAVPVQIQFQKPTKDSRFLHRIKHYDTPFTQTGIIVAHNELAGFEALRCEVVDLDRDAATVLMVESNYQRSQILPSEKAFAYKMRLEALSRQGKRTDLTSDPVGGKWDGKETAQMIGEQSGDSQTQVRRYIRLTNLVPELLDLVDEGKIKMRPAVELSYLDEDSQRAVVDEIDLNQCTPSHDQTIRMRKFFTDGKLTPEVVSAIMGEEKPNQREKIVLRGDKVRSLIPKNIPVSQTEDYVVKALEHYSRFLRQRAERDSR